MGVGKDVMVMMVSSEVIEKIDQLDFANMQSVIRYIDFLLHEQRNAPRKTHVQLGCLKGHLKYISDDFDARIDDFEEYM